MDDEPVLAGAEIQGNVLPGFKCRHQALAFLEIVSADQAAAWLRERRITTLADVVWARHGRGSAGPGATPPWTNVALSYSGLAKLVPDADRLTDVALKQGLHRRSPLLGDPADEDAPGDPRNWLVGRPDQGVDILLILGGDDRPSLIAELRQLRNGRSSGVRVVFEQHAGRLPPPLDGREPFGFCDDISQPAVRGRLSDAADDFLERRESAGAGLPGQRLVWPGEFVFGYPGQDALDRVRPGAVAEGGPPWTRNASLLVLRRLRQDVEGFHAFLRTAARDLARRHRALADMTPEHLAAKLMGRWPSGAPLIGSPDSDRPAVARDPHRRNDFAFRAAGDADGLMCPRAAHIRRAYLRDASTSGLTEANIETHRLLRRSIPFADGSTGERGLLFLAYQTSIERQFEFVTRAWLNNPHLHDTDDGHDPIAGQSFGTRGDRARLFSIAVPDPTGGSERIQLTIPHDWVVPTGGGYFFAPAAGVLRSL